MNNEKLQYFEDLLKTWLNDLMRHADEEIVRIRESDYFPDSLDRASFDSERSFQLRIRDRSSVSVPNASKDIFCSLNLGTK